MLGPPSEFGFRNISEKIEPTETLMTLFKAFPNLDEEYRSSLNNQLPVRVSPTHFECFASHESVNIRIFNQLRRVLVPIEPQYDKRSCSVQDTDGIVGLDAL